MSQQEKDQLVTPVIFRWWKNEVIALFPADPGTSEYDCMSYMHVGQHSAADDRMIIRESRPATAAEYADLKAELESIGYNLKIYRRWQYRFLEMREDEIARINIHYGLKGGEMYQYRLPNTINPIPPYRIASGSRWTGVNPEYFTSSLYQIADPDGKRTDYTDLDDAIRAMQAVTRLSNWRKVQE